MLTWREASWARIAASIEARAYILPWGSWSPKRFSGMSTLRARTSNVLTGAPAGHGVPGPEPAIARSVPACASSPTGARTTSASAP